MTNLYGLCAEKEEANLVDTNIKDGVDIFGVEGSYEGEIPVSSVPGYVINETSYNAPNGQDYPTTFSNGVNFEWNGNIYSLYHQYYIFLTKLDLSTNQVTQYEDAITMGYGDVVNSYYIDGNYLYINVDDTGHVPILLYHTKYDLINKTEVTNQSGYHTSGINITSTPYVLKNGIKYTGLDIMKNGSGNQYSNYHNYGFKLYT